MSRAGEFDWIARYFAPLAGDGAFDLKDDAALVDVAGYENLIITQDAILEGIHFLPDDPLETVAQKALRVNLSDIVSKGGKPLCYSIALGVPDRWKDGDIEQFATGLASDQDTFGLLLTGGDTYRSPERLCVSVTMIGVPAAAGYRSRLGAQVGDLVFVSGTIGDAALGLKVAQSTLETFNEGAAFLLDAYRVPSPPESIGDVVSKFASASMDISDGLLGDCRKLCSSSNVAAELNMMKVPLSPAACRVVETDPGHWRAVLTGGDDYQTLCTVPVKFADEFRLGAKNLGVSTTAIGSITDGDAGKVTLDMGGNAVSIDEDSFSHF